MCVNEGYKATSACREINFDDSKGTAVVEGTSISYGGKMSYVVATVCGTGMFRARGAECPYTDVVEKAACTEGSDCASCEGDATLTDGI